MISDILSWLKDPTTYWPPARRDTHANRERYYRSRFIIGYAPYPRRLYAELLGRIVRRKGTRFAHFCDTGPVPANEIWVYARHDIDTRACIDGLGRLLEIDEEFEVPVAVFVRADNENYDVADCRGLVGECRRRKIEVGLHTSCYMHDDFMAAFAAETNRFRDTLGFQPQSFTTHGTGKRQDVRALFNEAIKARLGEFGYRASDCHPSLRPYEYAIGDSFLDPVSNRRVVHNDFRDLPAPYLGMGRSYLILTHPMHWL